VKLAWKDELKRIVSEYLEKVKILLAQPSDYRSDTVPAEPLIEGKDFQMHGAGGVS
jgi:hypothetical protein